VENQSVPRGSKGDMKSPNEGADKGPGPSPHTPPPLLDATDLPRPPDICLRDLSPPENWVRLRFVGVKATVIG